MNNKNKIWEDKAGHNDLYIIDSGEQEIQFEYQRNSYGKKKMNKSNWVTLRTAISPDFV